MATNLSSVKQKCFTIVENCSGNCLLYDYSNGDVRLLSSDAAILSYLRVARFGSFFILVYYKGNVRRSLSVLVDERKWLQISKPMVYHFLLFVKKP